MFKNKKIFDSSQYVGNRLISRPARLLMWGWFLGGITFIMGTIFPEIDVNPAIAPAPYTELILGLLLLAGSLMMNLSVLNWRNESTGWRFELIALPILTTAWLMYLLLIVTAATTSLFPLALGLGHIAYCGMRFYEVNMFIDNTRENVKQMHKTVGDPDA